MNLSFRKSQPLKGDEFAMGLQFSLVVYDWIGSP
jgi:hypothetical protein